MLTEVLLCIYQLVHYMSFPSRMYISRRQRPCPFYPSLYSQGQAQGLVDSRSSRNTCLVTELVSFPLIFLPSPYSSPLPRQTSQGRALRLSPAARKHAVSSRHQGSGFQLSQPHDPLGPVQAGLPPKVLAHTAKPSRRYAHLTQSHQLELVERAIECPFCQMKRAVEVVGMPHSNVNGLNATEL